jgi:parallel beta-helix repeat protein
MQKVPWLVILCALIFASFAYSDPKVWYVHKDSSINSIQAALDSCSADDIVLVGPGTYYETIFWPCTPGINLISELGPDVTIIDGDTARRLFFFDFPLDTSTIIRGFTLQNGRVRIPERGGAICCYNYASPLITDNKIINNEAYIGGAIYCEQGSPVLTNNFIVGNTAVYGGGMVILYTSVPPVVENNTFELNYAKDGAGIVVHVSSLVLKNNIIKSNKGDGIYLFGSSPVIDSCTISSNYGAGIFCAGPMMPVSDPVIHYCNIVNNTGYGIYNPDSSVIINAEYNWWGHVTGPYNPETNAGGLGDSVSSFVDFVPWLQNPAGVEEQTDIIRVDDSDRFSATIFCGPLCLPSGKDCRVIDITGRVVAVDKMKPGVYFVQTDGVITQKIIKLR